MHAPHSPMPQPYFVPTRPNESRSTQSIGVSGATSTEWDRPLTLRVYLLISVRGSRLGLLTSEGQLHSLRRNELAQVRFAADRELPPNARLRRAPSRRDTSCRPASRQTPDKNGTIDVTGPIDRNGLGEWTSVFTRTARFSGRN